MALGPTGKENGRYSPQGHLGSILVLAGLGELNEGILQDGRELNQAHYGKVSLGNMKCNLKSKIPWRTTRHIIEDRYIRGITEIAMYVLKHITRNV